MCLSVNQTFKVVEASEPGQSLNTIVASASTTGKVVNRNNILHHTGNMVNDMCRFLVHLT